MLIVEVYVVHLQPLQRSVASLAHVLGSAVHAQPSTVLSPLVAELGCEGYLIPPVGDRPANEPLIGKGPVHICGVQEGDTKLNSVVDGGYRFVVVPGAVELAHAHASQDRKSVV